MAVSSDVIRAPWQFAGLHPVALAPTRSSAAAVLALRPDVVAAADPIDFQAEAAAVGQGAALQRSPKCQRPAPSWRKMSESGK
jgi:hypothetical protein